MNKNILSDIYENSILLAEAKNNVVAPAGKLEITKGGKEPLASGTGTERVKKNLKTPEEDAKYSGVKKKSMSTESNNTYEGAFERLFKSTLNEETDTDLHGEGPEIPTSDEDAIDEIGSTDDESGISLVKSSLLLTISSPSSIRLVTALLLGMNPKITKI